MRNINLVTDGCCDSACTFNRVSKTLASIEEEHHAIGGLAWKKLLFPIGSEFSLLLVNRLACRHLAIHEFQKRIYYFCYVEAGSNTNTLGVIRFTVGRDKNRDLLNLVVDC